MDVKRTLKMVGRNGSFRKKLIKINNKWQLKYEYEPSYAYMLYTLEIRSLEERIKQRTLKTNKNE